ARQAKLLHDCVELDLAVVKGCGNAVVAVNDPISVFELDELNGRQPLQSGRRSENALPAAPPVGRTAILERQEVSPALRRAFDGRAEDPLDRYRLQPKLSN